MIVTVTLNPSLDEWVQLPAIRIGQLNRAAAFTRYAGGKGINVSRVVRELGGRTTALAFAGGEDGVILREMMHRLGIRHDFVAIQGSTRNNYKLLTGRPKALTEINTAGPRIFPANLRALERRVLARRPRSTCTVFSGSLPPGAPQAIYARWIRILRHRGGLTVLDASGAALRQGLSARPWLTKPNRQEAEELLGRSLGTRSRIVGAVRGLLARGPEIVILSLGREGAMAGRASTRELWWAEPPAVRVNSAVGAGDALVGGFLVGWFSTRSFREAFRLGVACGAATAMTPGTELCHRGDVHRLLPRVRLRQLETAPVSSTRPRAMRQR